MSEEKKYRNYTAADIEKYHKGLLSPREMNELEKAALDDPFLADALEGYGTVATNAAADLSELEKKLQERVAGAKVVAMTAPRNTLKWWKAAAAVVIIGGLGVFTYRLSTGNRANKLVNLEPNKKSNDKATLAPIVDSNRLKTSESAGLVDANKDTITFGSSTRNSSTGFLNTTKSKSNKDVASTDVTAPVTYKHEKSDTTIDQKQAIVTTNVLGKAAAKKPEAENRPAEGFATMQQKEGVLREQQNVNYFRGRVIDANNNPLPFANITNTRDNVGTYADAKGNFTLISPDSTLDVQIRSIGFENNLSRLRNNVISNQIILQEEETAPDKVLSFKKRDTGLYRKSNMTLEEPEPADGWSNYGVYLANNTNVPDDLEQKQVNRGNVQVSFDVNQNGDPVNLKVEKSLCQKCDQEAIRLIREGPKWKKKNKKK